MSVTSAAKPTKPEGKAPEKTRALPTWKTSIGAYEVEGLNVEHFAKISRKGSELLPKNWRDLFI
jgi:hypothetical protein